MLNTSLDSRHAENFQLMLQSLRLTPFSPVGLTSMFIKPVAPQPMTPQGAYAEAELFAAQAYGATLGLIYYRCLGDALRQAWDASMEKMLQDTRQGLTDDLRSAQGAWEDVRRTSGADVAARARQDAIGISAQNKRKKIDFLVALQSKKMSVFPGTSQASVNDPNIVGQNPWCQSDSEFEQAVQQEVGATNPETAPSFNYGLNGRARQATANEQASKVLNTMLTAKFTEYLGDFLETGEKAIPSLLHLGISKAAAEVLNKIPLADLIVDFIKDKLIEGAEDRLVEAFKRDRERRLRLAQWRWGLYADPQPALPPGASDFTQQVLR